MLAILLVNGYEVLRLLNFQVSMMPGKLIRFATKLLTKGQTSFSLSVSQKKQSIAIGVSSKNLVLGNLR